MILVTIGMHSQGFERLIKKIDELSLKIKEKFVVQVGDSKYLPKNTEWFEFKNYADIIELSKRSKLIITHAGAGSILTCIDLKKPFIVVPRLKEYNEAIDDHQKELASIIEKRKIASVVWNIEDLKNAIKNFKKPNTKTRKQEFILNLRKIINELS